MVVRSFWKPLYILGTWIFSKCKTLFVTHLPQYRHKIFHPHVTFGRNYGIKKLSMWQIRVWQTGFFTLKKFSVPGILMKMGKVEGCDTGWQIIRVTWGWKILWRYWGRLVQSEVSDKFRDFGKFQEFRKSFGVSELVSELNSGRN